MTLEEAAWLKLWVGLMIVGCLILFIIVVIGWQFSEDKNSCMSKCIAEKKNELLGKF